MRDSEIKIRIGKGDKSIWQNVAVNRGLSLTELIMQSMEVFLEGVPTYYDTSVPTEEVVPTKKDMSLEGLIAEIDSAMEVGDRDNWVRVKKLISDMGYEWNITTRTLSKDGRVVWKYS